MPIQAQVSISFGQMAIFQKQTSTECVRLNGWLREMEMMHARTRVMEDAIDGEPFVRVQMFVPPPAERK